MTGKRKQMNVIEKQLAAVQAEIARLRIKEEAFAELLRELAGEPAVQELATRRRSPGVKPHVLDYMKEVGARGATTSEVDDAVRTTNPTVAKDTVGSVLSRLKSEGALVYEGERYYEKKHSPARPNDGMLRMVS